MGMGTALGYDPALIAGAIISVHSSEIKCLLYLIQQT